MSFEKTTIVNLHHDTIDDSVICLQKEKNIKVFNVSNGLSMKRKFLLKKNKILDRQELTKKEVDTLTSSSLSDDNTLKQCKIKLDEILHRQPKSRMKYDRDGNTLSISSSDDGNTNKSLSSDDKLLSHQCEHRPLKIQWTTSSEESSSSTLSVVKLNSNLSENFIRKEILFQIKTFPEAT